MSGEREEDDVLYAPVVVDLERILDKCFPSPLRKIDHCCREGEGGGASVNGNVDWHSCPVYNPDVGIVGRKISKGESFDVISLLSWTPRRMPSRNFLLTRDGSKVDIKTLEGKYVVVCCVFLPLHYRFHRYAAGILGAIFAAAAAADCPFQLVIVPKLRPGFRSHLVIDHFFSGIPSTCLTLPYDSYISCDNACSSLGLSGYLPLATLIVDPNGTVLQTACNRVQEFGIDAFPFTDQHLLSLSYNTELLRCRVDDIYFKTKGVCFLKQEKLTPCPAITLNEMLLCDPSHRLPLATDENVSVSVSDLNAGYVGLYLCSDGNLMRSLSQLHQQCTHRGHQFDILIIPLAFLDPPSSFLHSIRLGLSKYNISSWWLFPFNDRVCRQLWRLFHCSPLEKLIILPPAGSGLSGELQGNAVITRFGVDAYPFTRASILERNLERLRKITLKQLFPEDCTVCRSEKHPLNVSHLKGKKVFIYLDPEYHPCPELLFYLSKIRNAHPDSVLVYVAPKSYKDVTEKDHRPVPWLVSRSCFTDVISILFGKGEKFDEGTIVAVKNGRILSRQAQLHLDENGAFPFADYLRREIASDLSQLDYIYD